MKTPFLLLALAALPMWGGQEPGAKLAPVALYTNFRQPPSAIVLDSMRSELQSIMSPIGLNFEWRDLAASDGQHVSVELAVVNFKGSCDATGVFSHDSNPGALGWTHISDGVILPFADVDCEAVSAYLQRELLSVPTEQRSQIFGRALGRVLAHELYHIFANTTHHGSEGVGRSVYSVQDLIAPEFHFEGRETLALKTSKAHTALSLAGAAADGMER